MQDLDRLVSQNKSLYRELFLKAKESLDAQINSIKYKSYCHKCHSCCKTRYYTFSPLLLKKFSEQDEAIKYFIEYFIPFGTDENYDYSSEIDIKENNKDALEQDKDYVLKVLKEAKEELYFYTCRFLKDKKCTSDKKNINVCFNFPENIEKALPAGCGYDKWHKNVVDLLDNTIAKDVCTRLKQVNLYRDEFQCSQCATCCKFASSEFSYQELTAKAKNNDNFATQFVSVFVPYQNEDKAREVYPEYYEFIKKSITKEEKVYFYHCKHIKEGTLCPIYEDRPQICRDFPDNPLTFLPPSCGYCQWKEETEVQTLLCHSVISLLDYYLDLLR